MALTDKQAGSPARAIYTCDNCGKEFEKQKTRAPCGHQFCSRLCFFAHLRAQKPVVTCKNCGKSFRRSAALIGKQIFCSVKCMKEAKRIELTCPVCGKHFWRHKSYVATIKTAYCSKACSHIGMRCKKIELVCDWCGDQFERYPSEIKKAEKRGYRFVFCSHACRAAMIAAQFNPPRPYNGEHTSPRRNTSKNHKWRKAVFERDNYTCQECGTTIKMLCAHHIRPASIYPAERYSVQNGVTLCYKCHTAKHSSPSR